MYLVKHLPEHKEKENALYWEPQFNTDIQHILSPNLKFYIFIQYEKKISSLITVCSIFITLKYWVFAAAGWRDADSQKPRLDGQVGELDDLFNQVCNSRPQHAAEIKAIEPGQETPLNLRKAQKKKSIKNLFTPAPKFHRNLKK